MSQVANAGTNDPRLESFSYDDQIVRKFLTAMLVWGVVAFLVGITIAIQLLQLPFYSNLGISYLSFGRLRPLHTNAAIFAFAGNAIFASVYYSTQRLLKARMFSDKLSNLHFWGWQLIIVLAAVTLPLGFTQAKEYAELEWPIDLLIAIVWVGFFAVNFFGTIAKRRERHLYVAIWFYIATIVTIAVLHVFNNLIVPVGLFKSYSIYAGVQDALMQWWYGHNAVAFFLTTPFLGLMYYFVPKAANRPVFSYRLSIVHFWSLVFIYIWAGPHHLHYSAIPDWASSLGMVFSLMLWMPSWGGMLNGLLTLRGAWNKVTSDPILKFFVVSITFYGMATFEGPMLSIKGVNALSHFTDWTIAHVHSGALGWNGFMAFGMMYWLLPRLFQTELFSKKLAETHFWLATVGILLYIVPIYVAGITQGLMWRAMDDTGKLTYPDFVETVQKLMPFYYMRVLGGVCYLSGALLGGYNFYKTWKTRPAKYDEPVITAPALSDEDAVDHAPNPNVGQASNLGASLASWTTLWWHRRWERLPFRFTVYTTIAVVIASAFEIIPMFLIRSNIPTIASVKPYTPLELIGRDVYIANGCYNCHSQEIRPIYPETARYKGGYSKPGEYVYDHPFQWGSRRIGPDLMREGGKQSELWHYRHMIDPAGVTANSIMPSFPYLTEKEIDFGSITIRLKAMRAIGVPYSQTEIDNGIENAKTQAKMLADKLAAQNQNKPVANAEKTQMIALIAYLQRMGTDINATPAVAGPTTAPTTAPAVTEVKP